MGCVPVRSGRALAPPSRTTVVPAGCARLHPVPPGYLALVHHALPYAPVVTRGRVRLREVSWAGRGVAVRGVRTKVSVRV